MKAESRNDDWVYLKLYAGLASDRLEWFLTDTTPRVIETTGWDRWFFLRYFDDTGLHLRLRLRALPGGAKELARAIHPLCEDGLLGLSARPASTYRPMVTLGDAPPQRNFVGVVPDTYEPELDKFGGSAGITIAEEAFQASSEIAISIMRDERLLDRSRKTLLPSLMCAAVDAFAPNADHVELWRHYSEYWLRELGATAYSWRERFLAKSRRLVETGYNVVTPEGELPVESRAHLARWREALAQAARAYRGVPNNGAPMLASQFVHLMNNRLGCHALDEAYLATLLEERARSRVS